MDQQVPPEVAAAAAHLAAVGAAALEKRIEASALNTNSSGWPNRAGVAIFSPSLAKNPFTSAPISMGSSPNLKYMEGPDALKRVRSLHRFDHSQVEVLLLEGVHPNAVSALENDAGFQVTSMQHALTEEQLLAENGKLLRNVQVLGIRSKTQITAKILAAAPRLLAIGCFCIGTNQVDLNEAAIRGVAVFNSPYANSRSVAELTISNIIALARQLGDRNKELHQGKWLKVSKGCYEVRGKTLGIVGYGHIGSQLSVLAEALGMKVLFHDIIPIMPLGSARQVASLQELITSAQFVTLHVPETPDTYNMINDERLKMMRKGTFVINASRGTVVDVDALAHHLSSGHVAGAAVDVYPSEPSSNGAGFDSPLIGCPNTLLSPHIGGSTEEAQRAIGAEVSRAITEFINQGTTMGSVNLPNLHLSPSSDLLTIRITHVHKNVPGVLNKVNNLLSHFNIERQISEARKQVAYLMADVTLEQGKVEDQLRAIHTGISSIPENILSRVFY